MAITWVPKNVGGAEPIPTAENPDLYDLTSPTDRFYRFNGIGDPGMTPTATFSTSDWYNLLFEITTDRGPRSFKFAPSIREIRFRDNYRYDVGLEGYSRSGGLQSFFLDFPAIADIAEPGVTIISIDAIFARVRGQLRIQLTGSTAPPPPPPPPPGEMSEAEIVRFLNQAGFGATQDSIAEVAAIGGYEQWIDQQLDLPASFTAPYTRANGSDSTPSPRHEAWWNNAIGAPDQLRQRLAFAWSELFVVSDRSHTLSNSKYGMVDFYDTLIELADGNFRELLERITLHPVMGDYLSMVRNERADPDRNVRPDENFAREVMQLFTIGLNKLTDDGQIVPDRAGNPIPTYTQPVVANMARVFTGWSFPDLRSFGDTNIGGIDMRKPMEAYEEFHDTGEKTILDGIVLPAGQTAYQDLTATLDALFNHSNVGPFIARTLIQRLVTSNPSAGYVGRVAAAFNNTGGIRGDLRATAKAVLLDEEARTGHITSPATFGKMKEPIMRLTQLWRAFDAQPGPESNGIFRPNASSLLWIENVVEQAPMRSRSVFNFFLPTQELAPGSSLAGPETQILTEFSVAATNNMLLQCIYGDNNRSVQYRQNITQIQIEPWVTLAGDVPALLDRLDVLLCAGQLPPAIRSEIESLISSYTGDDEGRYQRFLAAAYCIVGSPFHLVQK